jgi:hypothetical protein
MILGLDMKGLEMEQESLSGLYTATPLHRILTQRPVVPAWMGSKRRRRE